MSLDYDLTGIEGLEEKTPEERAVTDGLIWSTLAAGMGKITAENADQFYARVRIAELLLGAVMAGPSGAQPITPVDVKANIGLKTNVGMETNAAWRKRMFEAAERRGRELYKRAS